MANTTIQLRYSTETGNVPVSLANGEIAINTQDGKLFYADPSGTVQEFSGFPGPSGLDTEIQFNDSGVLGANSRLTFNKTTGTLTANSFVTSGSFGNILAANTIYANNFVANTGFIQFSDGTKQYTANVPDSYARNTANAAFIHANAAFDAANTSGGSSGNSFGVIYTSNNSTFANAATANDQVNFVGESGIVVWANAVTKTITVAGTPGAQGLTVDYGSIIENLNYSIDYGTTL